MIRKRGEPKARDSFRVLRKPSWDEMGCSYEIVDPAGRAVRTESDLDEALAAAAYLKEHLRERKAA